MRPSKTKVLGLCIVGLFLLTGAALGTNEEEDEFDDVGEAASVAASSEEDEFDVKYESPKPMGHVYFAEHFDDLDLAKKNWIPSRAQKEEEDNVFKYEGKWEFEFPQKRLFPTDQALVIKSKAKHLAISAKLTKPFDFTDKPLIVQYEVTFQNGMDCGGAYIKLLSHSKDMKLETFHDKTPYTIMFGPDKCGSDVKMHFIFRHKNPVNGTFSEKHAKRPSNRVEDTFTDKKPHLYRLKLMPNNKYEVFVDGRLINQGSLLDDVEPSVNPPMDIEDPDDVKPADWDEREKISDTSSKKPDDWDDDAPPKIPDPKAAKPTDWLEDEAEMIADASAVKPDDWDESMDGSWEAPLISNPKCEGAGGCGPWIAPLIENPNFKGKWKAPMINNPNYKGKWTRRTIPNPGYFEDKEPFKMTSIGAVGLEIWTMTDLVLFDNFIIADDDEIIEDWTSKTWDLKRLIYDRDSEGVVRRLINYSNAHPWLWAIYVFVIGLPLVLIFTYCCGSGQDKKVNDNLYKKTDELSPDDDIPENVRSKSRDKSSERSVPSTSRVAMSKDELEQPEEKRDDSPEAEAEGSEYINTDDVETEPDTEEEEERALALSSRKTSLRKRRE